MIMGRKITRLKRGEEMEIQGIKSLMGNGFLRGKIIEKTQRRVFVGGNKGYLETGA